MICGLFKARAMADWKTALTDWLEPLVEKLDHNQAQRKRELIVGDRNQLSRRGRTAIKTLLPSQISQRCRPCRMHLRLQWKSFCQSKR
jgi:hypothetical protein